ncbi:hypothetical protein AAC387_Pa02g4711 [Persea americana]
MAEVVLSALLQVVFDKLVPLITEEQGMKWGVNKEMERLKSMLPTIQAVLEDAEKQRVEDKALRNWLGKLKDAAYDADDILDEFMTEALQRKIVSRGDHMMNKELPKEMRNMLNLRHLEIFTNEPLIEVPRRFKSFTKMPVHIGKLKCLQTLPIFIVGTSMGCRIRELKDLNLCGELFIKSLENVKDANDSKEANLKNKQNLHTLGLSWNSCDNDPTVRENIEQILEGLEPHPNLKRLLLDNYTGIRFPHWRSESLLPNLNEIALVNCRRCESLPSFGQLPFLKALTICGMDAVRCIDDAFYGNNVTSIFPSLEEFTIEDMPNLEEISAVERNWEVAKNKNASSFLFPVFGKR